MFNASGCPEKPTTRNMEAGHRASCSDFQVSSIALQVYQDSILGPSKGRSRVLRSLLQQTAHHAMES